VPWPQRRARDPWTAGDDVALGSRRGRGGLHGIAWTALGHVVRWPPWPKRPAPGCRVLSPCGSWRPPDWWTRWRSRIFFGWGSAPLAVYARISLPLALHGAGSEKKFIRFNFDPCARRCVPKTLPACLLLSAKLFQSFSFFFSFRRRALYLVQFTEVLEHGCRWPQPLSRFSLAVLKTAVVGGNTYRLRRENRFLSSVPLCLSIENS
jgi:hypothetical protein